MEIKRLIIEKCPVHSNCYLVRQGERYIDRLTWDELIGLVAFTTCPKGDGWGDTLFQLRTEEEWHRLYESYEPCVKGEKDESPRCNRER